MVKEVWPDYYLKYKTWCIHFRPSDSNSYYHLHTPGDFPEALKAFYIYIHKLIVVLKQEYDKLAS